MKKFLPFTFPLIALAIVCFLGYKWYTAQVPRPEGKISEFGEGIKIEELSQEEMNKLSIKNTQPQAANDTKTLDLQGSGEIAGELRYEIKNERVQFSVFANLPELKKGVYQVWLKEVGTEKKTKAFTLELTKSGYIGSAAVSASTLPFEVVVSQEMSQGDQVMELSLLKGTLQK